MNRYLQATVIAPITSNSKPYQTRVEVKHKIIRGWIAIDQIRTIDIIRIIKRFETLLEKEIENVKNVIQETFVD